MIKESRAYRYAKWCVSRGNRKVGKYVKLQARKWLKIADGRHKKAYISEKSYRKICKLLKLMVHPDLHCSMYDGLEDYAWNGGAADGWWVLYADPETGEKL